MHVHLIGIAGTGMGAFAGLLRSAGHRVTGSDTAFYPPMGDALRAWGIETRVGFAPENLEPAPDLVIVGNVCRPTNPEARAAIERGLRHASFPRALSDLFLATRTALVVGGTHGKTTTSALLAYLLDRTRPGGREIGFLIGGIPLDFPESFRAGAQGAPFVVEGDEYDCAFYEKSPKFWQYRPWGAIVTSIEHDHIDIYPTPESYLSAFTGFMERLAPDGVLVAAAHDPLVRLAARGSRARVVRYALAGDDTAGEPVDWLARPEPVVDGRRTFRLVVRGEERVRAVSPLPGLHNVRNTVAALALAHEACGASLPDMVEALGRFRGIKRRQELRGTVSGVTVYDDFAHHPSAVRETIAALRERHPHGRIAAVFEPRSATASRRLHQHDYPDAFARCDLALLAPVGRPEIPADEKLDVAAIARELRARGIEADAPESVDAIVARLCTWARESDAIAILSNGAFGGIHDELLRALAARAA